MKLRYTFEKMYNHKHKYQVRLNGEFVTYISERRSELVDQILHKAGYNSREEWFQEKIERNMEFLENS
jgi:hypothetical protein